MFPTIKSLVSTSQVYLIRSVGLRAMSNLLSHTPSFNGGSDNQHSGMNNIQENHKKDEENEKLGEEEEVVLDLGANIEQEMLSFLSSAISSDHTINVRFVALNEIHFLSQRSTTTSSSSSENDGDCGVGEDVTEAINTLHEEIVAEEEKVRQEIILEGNNNQEEGGERTSSTSSSSEMEMINRQRKKGLDQDLKYFVARVATTTSSSNNDNDD